MMTYGACTKTELHPHNLAFSIDRILHGSPYPFPINGHHQTQTQGSSNTSFGGGYDGSANQNKIRRPRFCFRTTHTQVMEQLFTQNHYPDFTQRNAIAKQLGIPEARIQVWFQNRRAKYRRNECTRKTAGRPAHNAKPTSCSGKPMTLEEICQHADQRERRNARKKQRPNHYYNAVNCSSRSSSSSSNEEAVLSDNTSHRLQDSQGIFYYGNVYKNDNYSNEVQPSYLGRQKCLDAHEINRFRYNRSVYNHIRGNDTSMIDSVRSMAEGNKDTNNKLVSQANDKETPGLNLNGSKSLNYFSISSLLGID